MGSGFSPSGSSNIGVEVSHKYRLDSPLTPHSPSPNPPSTPHSKDDPPPVSTENGSKIKVYALSGLEAEDIGQLGDQGSFRYLSRGGPGLVVYQEKIAQGLVDQIKTNIAANFPQLTVVLNQCI
jgi:hypothetical protein